MSDKDEIDKQLEGVLSWEEKCTVYADVVYSNYKKQLAAKAHVVTPQEHAYAIMALALVLADGHDILVKEGEQDAQMAIGFLSGYVMGRVHE